MYIKPNPIIYRTYKYYFSLSIEIHESLTLFLSEAISKVISIFHRISLSVVLTAGNLSFYEKCHFSFMAKNILVD